MTLTVHTISGAPRGWRILLGLTFKGLDYDVRYLQASAKEQRSPEFLALNPRGKVPILTKGDDIVLRESLAILTWLERQYPEKPLFGETPEEATRIWQSTSESCHYLRDAIHDVLSNVFGSDGSVPAEGSKEMTVLLDAAARLHTECQALENLLGDRPFLAGDRPSAADAVAFPEIRLVQRGIEIRQALMSALGFANLPFSYPKLTAWMDRIAAVPGFEKTLPVHWKAQPAA